MLSSQEEVVLDGVGWTLIQCLMSLKEEGNFDTDTQGECHVTLEAEIRVMCLHASEHQGLPKLTRSSEEVRKSPFLQLLEIKCFY